MPEAIPALDTKILAAVEALKANPKIARGIATALEESDKATSRLMRSATSWAAARARERARRLRWAPTWIRCFPLEPT